MGLSSPGVLSALHQHLLWLAVANLNQFSPVQCTKQIDSIRHRVACHVTSNLDCDQGGSVIQIEWTKAFCNNCQPIL